jgi:hypothetical protein
MTSPLNTWTVNADGSVTFNGTVNFPAGTNLASGAGIAIFGPNGGTTNFPAVEQGEPGLPPIINFTVTQVAFGTTLPSPNPTVTLVTAGGAGVASEYNVTIFLNAGEPGTATVDTATLTAAIEGTAAALFDIGFDATNNELQWQPKLVGNWYYSGTVGATDSTTVTVKNMTSIAVPGQPFAWWPEVAGYGNVVGAVDTRVDIVARLNSSTPASGTGSGSGTGQELGRGFGAAGATPPPTSVVPNMLAIGSDNIVAAGTAATIFFNAENQTSSSNAWNTTSSAFFQVRPSPVPQ